MEEWKTLKRFEKYCNYVRLKHAQSFHIHAYSVYSFDVNLSVLQVSCQCCGLYCCGHGSRLKSNMDLNDFNSNGLISELQAFFAARVPEALLFLKYWGM